MHEAVFEAGWDSDEFIGKHRATVAVDHHGRGKEVIDLDWTFAHHEKGPQIYGVKKEYDYVEGRTGRFITVVTAVICNPSRRFGHGGTTTQLGSGGDGILERNGQRKLQANGIRTNTTFRTAAPPKTSAGIQETN